MEKLDVVNAALAALRAGETCELVVVAGTAGSSPRGVGAWMTVFADGSQAGTIGGGKIELFALDEARELLAAGQSRLVRYTMGGENSDTGINLRRSHLPVLSASGRDQGTVVPVGCRRLGVSTHRRLRHRL